MSSLFERENRYIVLKRSDIEAIEKDQPDEQREKVQNAVQLSLNNVCDWVNSSRSANGKAPLECLVIESDWPEYEHVWRMIEDRMSGKAALSQQGSVQLQFPTMLRKMWSGGEVQEWLDKQGPLFTHPQPQKVESKVPQSVEEFIEKNTVMELVDRDGGNDPTFVLYPMDVKDFFDSLMAGKALVPVSPMLQDLRYLVADIKQRSRMDETCKEGQVFVGHSAWCGLLNAIETLEAAKGE